ncbi:type II toxin-antitoxin system PemK/MazF family toxin [Nocardia cyriacigeorgica]|uniref:Type II toxin-antitoxin system PemK/MazF family toxin n=2 Tax=Nocardia cyriacigeorgica TaxID=135487 RepID=A0A5R8PBZ2_9NOCA|nr:type II toxin-antitoxin system PemK/MazF family toxin [Nocardia cyriacigeorgica]
MIRGMVYRVDLGDAKRGHEQRGRRYGVVLSRTSWSMVTIVPTSTSAAPSRSRVEVEVAGRSTRLLVDQIRSIDVSYLVGDPVGFLSAEDMGRLDATICHYLGLGRQ